MYSLEPGPLPLQLIVGTFTKEDGNANGKEQ